MKGILTMWLALAIIASAGSSTVSQKPSKVEPSNVSYEWTTPPYPKQVTTAWQALRKTTGWDVIRLDGKSYVVITAGLRPSGGYSLEIERSERTAEGTTILYVVERPPAATAMTTQALTYPSLVAVLPDDNQPIQVVFYSQ